MKTLTVQISDEAARKLAEHASQNGKTPEEWATRLVEEAFDDSWLSDLSPEDRAAIEQGWDEAERGDTIPHEEIVAEMRQKFGW
ncbi:MAG: hypothetical protein NVV62_05935 [Terricaulis sp.]|nr:hypothetical protein [Terricaulis sp.]